MASRVLQIALSSRHCKERLEHVLVEDSAFRAMVAHERRNERVCGGRYHRTSERTPEV